MLARTISRSKDDLILANTQTVAFGPHGDCFKRQAEHVEVQLVLEIFNNESVSHGGQSLERAYYL